VSQTIRRAARRRQFVIVDQRAIEDGRLSWAARGLLTYLLSRPDDWRVLVNDLKKRGDLKRDGIYKLLRELRAAGYVCFEHTRDARGRMRGGTYIVSEVPDTALPDAGAPNPEQPLPADPAALLKTELNLLPTTTTKTTPTQQQTKEWKEAEPLQFPDWLPEETSKDARRLLAGLDPADAKLVINEWTGAWAAGEIRVSALGYLKALARSCREGSMTRRHLGETIEP